MDVRQHLEITPLHSKYMINFTLSNILYWSCHANPLSGSSEECYHASQHHNLFKFRHIFVFSWSISFFASSWSHISSILSKYQVPRQSLRIIYVQKQTVKEENSYRKPDGVIKVLIPQPEALHIKPCTVHVDIWGLMNSVNFPHISQLQKHLGEEISLCWFTMQIHRWALKISSFWWDCIVAKTWAKAWSKLKTLFKTTMEHFFLTPSIR